MDKKTPKYRAFIAVVQIQNMINAGLSEQQYTNPEFLAKFLTQHWNSSGKDRTSAVAVCVSKEGLYHAHMALYSANSTTFNNVRTLMFQSHIEPQRGGKSELTKYMLKEPPYDEKGETILYHMGIENIQNVQGRRTDIENIEEMLKKGYKPSEIFKEDFSYRKYSKMILEAFLESRLEAMPPIQKKYVEYHFGESGSGKSYYYNFLCEQYGTEDIYFAKDNKIGVFDNYLKVGAPKILFLDELKGLMTFAELLGALDQYTRAQIHARYNNAYGLWEKVYITSVFPPEKVYTSMNPSASSHVNKYDDVKQLLRRIDVVVYHYIDEDGNYQMLRIPMSEYKGALSLKTNS